MRVYQFRHVGIVLLASTAYCFTADHNENNSLLVVPTKGLEPLHPKAHGPEPCASTNSATWALLLLAACRCVFCSEDKIIRAGAHSVNQHFALFFKKHVFSPEKGCSLWKKIKSAYFFSVFWQVSVRGHVG